MKMASRLTGGGPVLLVLACTLQCLLAYPQDAVVNAASSSAPAAPSPTLSPQTQDVSTEESGRVLGSSVVTSVSVIADGHAEDGGVTVGVNNGTGSRTYASDSAANMAAKAQGQALRKRPQGAHGAAPAGPGGPATVGSPAGLMSPDRYEFYTFDETGDLVRRHMTLDEIKSLLAGGDGDIGDTPIATFYHGPVPAPGHPPAHSSAQQHMHPQGVLAGMEDPEDALEDAVKGVQDVVNNVQNVLKSQLAASKNKLPAYIRPPAHSPPHAPSPSEAAATWGMILPGIMEGGIRPHGALPAATAPSTPAPTPRPTTTKTHKKPVVAQGSTTAKKPIKKPTTTSAPAASKEEPPVRFTLAPTTEQDIVDTLYTLVSSSPGLKQANDSTQEPVRNATPPPRPSTSRPSSRPPRPPAPQRPTSKPAVTAPHRVAAKPGQTKPVSTKPIKPSASKPTNSRPEPSKTASTKPTNTRPEPTKIASTKPINTRPEITNTRPEPTKTAFTKPTAFKPTTKPTGKPFKPAEHVQQRRPFPTQEHAESMVQIVTIPRPTTTMTAFVTFIPTELSVGTTPTTPQASPSSASPLMSPPSSPLMSPPSSPLALPSTFSAPMFRPTIPPTPAPESRRPPAMSYTYRVTTTETPFSTDSVSSADLDMDSRTTADEDDVGSTGTAGTTALPARTSPSSPSTSPSSSPPTSLPPTQPTALPSVWTTTSPPVTLPPTKMTTVLATTDLPLDSETSTPVDADTAADTTDPPRTTAPGTLAPGTAAPGSISPGTSAPETAAPGTAAPATVAPVTATTSDSKNAPIQYTEILTRVPASALLSKTTPEDDPEQTSTVMSTLPTTERVDEALAAVTTTSSKQAEASTEVDEDEEDGGSTEQVSEESMEESEATTKLYLKISSSENNGHLYSTSTTEASASEAATMTNTDLDARTTSAPSWETVVTDQSAASTEQRTTTASLPATSEEVESRTESEAETTAADLTSVSPSTTTSSSSTEAESTTTSQPASTVIPVTSTSSTAAPTSATSVASELSLESSNILTSQVDAPQAVSGLKMGLTTSTPTSPAVDVEANKVDVEAGNKVAETSSPASVPQPLWTRLPIVSSGEESSEGAAKPGTPSEDEAVKVYHSQQPSAVELHAAPHEHLGLEAATAALDPDVRSFVNLCNELAFQMWMAVKERSASTTSRSIVMSPFAATSTLAMVFLGARGPTSGQMNDVLRLDDMVSFNPHQVLWNVTEALVRPRSKNTGVATAALVQELYSDKHKGKLLDFYKERAQQFYDGHVEEIAFRNSGDLVRRKTNLLVKRQTRGRVQEYMRGSSLALRPPLAAFGANIFETDCTGASTEGRDGEMHFVVVPSSRQRRLVPVPAAVWRTGFLAGYDPALDATAVAMGPADAAFSTVFVLPGQQGHVAPGDGLSRLEQRLLESRGPSARWARLLRTLLPRPGMELQVPRFSHRSVLNMSEALQRMGLDELFSSEHADLRGLNGVAHDLHLSDVIQLNTFSTCGERAVDSRHHVEFYPTSPLASPGRRAARGRRLRPKVAEADDPRIELHPDNVGKDRDSYYDRLGDALEAAEARGSSGLTSSEEASASEDTSSSSASGSRESRTFQRIADFEDPDLMKVPLALRPRQARVPEAARLRFDRPFLFFVRHNPTGVLLHMGRFNPRLLP